MFIQLKRKLGYKWYKVWINIGPTHLANSMAFCKLYSFTVANIRSVQRVVALGVKARVHCIPEIRLCCIKFNQSLVMAIMCRQSCVRSSMHCTKIFMNILND